MSPIAQRLSELGIHLPAPWAVPPQFNFVTATVSGSMAHVSGHGPLTDGHVAYRGVVGRDVTVEEGYAAARLTMLLMLASLQAAIGSLDRVQRIVKVFGMVSATPDFERHPAVIDGASDLLVAVFGERGRHARSAVGMACLPMGIPVELEMIVEIL